MSAPKPVKPPRVLSPDHQYRVDLIAALAVARGGKESNHDADWKAAGAFFALDEGTPPIDQVVAWYRTEMQRPRWDTGYPDLHQLKIGEYRAYVRSAENYRQAIVRSRLAADGKLGASSRHTGAASRSTPVGPPASDTADNHDPWKTPRRPAQAAHMAPVNHATHATTVARVDTRREGLATYADEF